MACHQAKKPSCDSVPYCPFHPFGMSNASRNEKWMEKVGFVRAMTCLHSFEWGEGVDVMANSVSCSSHHLCRDVCLESPKWMVPCWFPLTKCNSTKCLTKDTKFEACNSSRLRTPCNPCTASPPSPPRPSSAEQQRHLRVSAASPSGQ